MVNQFRVLLCNLPYNAATPQDHLAKGFDGLVLTPQLNEFRKLLFPDGTSRDKVLFATQNLVNVVSSTTMRFEVVSEDPRITYASDANGAYFSATRIGNPIVSNSYFPLFAYGDYIPLNDRYIEDIRVSQISNSLAVRVYSGITGKVFIPSLTLGFDGDNLSQEIPLTEIGIILKIGGTNATFVNTAGKTWQVGVESPRFYNPLLVFDTLKANPDTVNNMLAQVSHTDTTVFESEWKNNSNNAVYRLAAILVCYVSRVRRLLS